MHVTPSPMAELSPRMRSLASSLSRWKMRVMRTRSRSSMLLLRASRDCRCASLATSSCRERRAGERGALPASVYLPLILESLPDISVQIWTASLPPSPPCSHVQDLAQLLLPPSR